MTENELPIGIEVEFDNKTGTGIVRGGIKIGLSLQLLAGTDEEIKLTTRAIKSTITDELIKLALQEIERRVTPTAPLAKEKYYVSHNITKGTKLIIIHPETLIKEEQEKTPREMY